MWASSVSFISVVIALNVIAVVGLSAYAFHQGILLLLYLRYKIGSRLGRRLQPIAGECESSKIDESPATPLPGVTVQLPLYNERYVAERAIAAACALDYPRHLLHIQVLDDSTDDTSRIVQRAIRTERVHGANIELIHREKRDGYKAGALANGLRTAQGELIAIFDADFVPPRDFLRRVVCEQRGFDDPRTAFVQTRWGHLNRDANAVTRAQVLMLDMHFVIDQYVRSRAGLKMNFNGSCGIWRRAAIDKAGGWQSDTLTEDLDLSYRSELLGWRGRYLDDVVCPGELPTDLLAFKRQQARWARGSAQCARKLFPQIVHSDMPLLHRLAACMHVSGYFVNVFVLLLAIITPLLMLDSSGMRLLPEWLSIMSFVGLSPILAMSIAQTAQGRFMTFLRNLPIAVVFGIGMSLSNSVAVISGLFGKTSGEFVRTPKSASSRSTSRVKRITGRHAYLLQPDWTIGAECALGLYALGVCIALIVRGAWLSIVPALIYACGFLSVVLGQIAPHSWTQSRGRTRQREVESQLPSLK